MLQENPQWQKHLRPDQYISVTLNVTSQPAKIPELIIRMVHLGVQRK